MLAWCYFGPCGSVGALLASVLGRLCSRGQYVKFNELKRERKVRLFPLWLGRFIENYAWRWSRFGEGISCILQFPEPSLIISQQVTARP